jgi:hypothetical protein
MTPAEWSDEVVSAYWVRHADTGILSEVGVIRRRWPASGRHSHFVVYHRGPLGFGAEWRSGERLLSDATQAPAEVPRRFYTRGTAERAAAAWAWLHGGRRWGRVVDQEERKLLSESFWVCACSPDLELPAGWRRLDPASPPPWAAAVLTEIENDAAGELVPVH